MYLKRCFQRGLHSCPRYRHDGGGAVHCSRLGGGVVLQDTATGAPAWARHRGVCGVAQDAAVAARRKARGKGGERRGETTLQERYGDVRDFWMRLPHARRRHVMRVPIRRLLEGACQPRFSLT